jgi:AcrR family transcriptional regulator
MDEKKNRQDWLTAGLQMLSSEGPNGMGIMPISRQLGVTKGSFYWHFKNLKEYQLALIAEWERSYAQHAIDYMEQMEGDADTKFRCWMTGAIGADVSLGRAIRTWSSTDENVKQAQERVDAQLIAYLAKLLCGIGWSNEESITLAHWTYWAFVGYTTVSGPFVAPKQLNLILDILRPK